ncbi:hypothetical protein JX266_011430 [Neoarthrinium moseri]|nr:hypothetical protein JX266_011430 [Neoarthrinium moseri]
MQHKWCGGWASGRTVSSEEWVELADAGQMKQDDERQSLLQLLRLTRQIGIFADMILQVLGVNGDRIIGSSTHKLHYAVRHSRQSPEIGFHKSWVALQDPMELSFSF